MKEFLLTVFSFFVAMVLTILPLPSWLSWFRPEWVALVVIYWVLVSPDRINIGISWLIGLLLDALTGSVLGAHALALVCVAYLIARFNIRISFFNLWQTTLVVFVMMCCYQLVLFCVYGMLGHLPGLLFWLPCLTSTVFWPWVYILISDGKKHFELSVVS